MASSLSTPINPAKLLHSLWKAQEDDHHLPPQTFLSVRHMLWKRGTGIKVIQIKTEPGQDPGYRAEISLIPHFIRGQLIDNKLIEPDSTEINTTWLLKFILESLYFVSFENPTVFRWFSASDRRHYNIFAFIDREMERRIYSIPELMELRAKSISDGGKNLDVNPEIAPDVVRKTGRESSESKGSFEQEGKHGHRFLNARVQDDSSVSSEEVLFKGTLRRRSRLPLRNSVEEPLQEPIRQLPHEPTYETLREQPREPLREANQNLPQEGDRDHRREGWNYRGRSESEVPSGEPVSAPAGIPAQRSEGFQRFYKAVVSPTHVRVTAGGRIVPNTRGPASPTSKRSKDDVIGESNIGVDKMTHTKAFPPPVGMVPSIPVMPQYIPGYPPGFQPIQGPMSYVPMAFGAPMAPGFPFSQPPTNPVSMAQPTDGNVLKETQNTKPGESHKETGTAQDKQEQVKLAPPELFDYTKPFFYNGQYMYPIPAAFPAGMSGPMMPYPMIGVPPSVSAPVSVPPAPAPALSNGPTQPMPAQTFTAPGQVPTTGAAHHTTLPAHSQSPAAPPAGPPISSIKPSDITKKQIATFKQSLKYHEDQLQFNRHQIDEKEMEHKCLTLRNHIARFEATLKSQLEYEASVLHNAQQKPEPSNANPAPVEAKQTSQTTIAEKSALTADFKVHESQAYADKTNHGSVRMTTGRGNLDFHAGQTDSGARPSHMCGYYTDTTGLSMSEYPKRDIPIGAALAPVFKPRGGYASSWGGSQTSKDASDEIDKRLLSVPG